MARIEKMLPACGFAIAVALVGITSAFKDAPKKSGDPTTYYFQFNGSNGQEDDPAQWSEIDESTYDLSSCNQKFRGCALATTSVTGTAPDLHPSQVDVDADPLHPMTNKSPKIGDGVTEVKNHDASY